jgi:hypothetical protein
MFDTDPPTAATCHPGRTVWSRRPNVPEINSPVKQSRAVNQWKTTTYRRFVAYALALLFRSAKERAEPEGPALCGS